MSNFSLDIDEISKLMVESVTADPQTQSRSTKAPFAKKIGAAEEAFFSVLKAMPVKLRPWTDMAAHEIHLNNDFRDVKKDELVDAAEAVSKAIHRVKNIKMVDLQKFPKAPNPDFYGILHAKYVDEKYGTSIDLMVYRNNKAPQNSVFKVRFRFK